MDTAPRDGTWVWLFERDVPAVSKCRFVNNPAFSEGVWQFDFGLEGVKVHARENYFYGWAPV
jgi:hypothetical protein